MIAPIVAVENAVERGVRPPEKEKRRASVTTGVGEQAQGDRKSIILVVVQGLLVQTPHADVALVRHVGECSADAIGARRALNR